MSIPEENSREPIARTVALYEHNTRLAEAFWEWQHKSLTLFSTGVGALLAIDAWMYDRDFGRWLAVPTAAAFLLSWLCAGMAGRNRRILNAAYERGAELEGKLRAGLDLQRSSIYQWLETSDSFYRRRLPWIFRATMAVSFAATVLAIVGPPHK